MGAFISFWHFVFPWLESGASGRFWPEPIGLNTNDLCASN